MTAPAVLPVLDRDTASDLAGRTLTAIDERDKKARVRMGTKGAGDRARRGRRDHARCSADRERVLSDLDGLLACWERTQHDDWELPTTATARHAQRYSDGLRRTASLYLDLTEKPCS